MQSLFDKAQCPDRRSAVVTQVMYKQRGLKTEIIEKRGGYIVVSSKKQSSLRTGVVYDGEPMPSCIWLGNISDRFLEILEKKRDEMKYTRLREIEAEEEEDFSDEDADA